MSSIGPKPVRLRLDPVAYERLRQVGFASRWLALSILWHYDELGSPSRAVSQPLGPRLRGEPDYALY